MILNQSLYLALHQTSKEWGVFASRLIKKGELILVLNGIERRGINYDGCCEGEENWFQVGDKKWLDDFGYGKFLNHSCDPNSTIFDLVKLRALKDIEPSEEVVIDFETIDWDDSVYGAFVCKCSSDKCRGIIRGYRFLPENVKNDYKRKGLIPDFLLKLESHNSIIS